MPRLLRDTAVVLFLLAVGYGGWWLTYGRHLPRVERDMLAAGTAATTIEQQFALKFDSSHAATDHRRDGQGPMAGIGNVDGGYYSVTGTATGVDEQDREAIIDFTGVIFICEIDGEPQAAMTELRIERR